MYSTITSPVFSRLVIVLGGSGVSYPPSEVTLFEALRVMNEVGFFKLAFLFEAEYYFREEA